MGAGRPDKGRPELGVALHPAEVFLHPLPDPLPGSLPSVLLSNPARQPVKRHRALTLDDAQNHPLQRKRVDVVEKPHGVGHDAPWRLSCGLSRRRGTLGYIEADLLARLVRRGGFVLNGGRHRILRTGGLGSGFKMDREARPIEPRLRLPFRSMRATFDLGQGGHRFRGSECGLWLHKRLFVVDPFFGLRFSRGAGLAVVFEKLLELNVKPSRPR